MRRRLLYVSSSLIVACYLLAATVAQADSALEQAIKASCRIARGAQSATGFLVEVDQKTGNRDERQLLLVTAAHFFKQLREDQFQIYLRRKVENGFERQTVTLQAKREGKPLWRQHPQDDVAVISVTLPANCVQSCFRLNQIADNTVLAERGISTGHPVFVPGFPARLESNKVGWPVVRGGVIASYPFPDAHMARFFINASIFPGDSGAPIVAVCNGEPVVVGLVTGMQRQTDRVVMPFQEHTVHTPLQIGIGVPAASIRDVIETLLAEKTKEQQQAKEEVKEKQQEKQEQQPVQKDVQPEKLKPAEKPPEKQPSQPHDHTAQGSPN